MRITIFLLFTLPVLFAANAGAKTRIAFLESRESNGDVTQYEPGGHFTHTAIQFDDIGDKWLNAYPGEGVAIISLEQLQHHGTIAAIIDISSEVHLSQVTPYLGRPFDFWYSWSDDAFYCSELIGKLLNVPTHPMTFNKAIWPKNYWKLDGTPGVSPDALFRWALEHKASVK